MASSIVVVLVAVVAAAMLFSPKIQNAKTWKATVTPLASIIGSGFLVSVPLLAGEVGNAAVFAMAGLIAIAYAVGATIRFNIRYAEPLFEEPVRGDDPKLAESIDKLSHLVLAFAYFISVTYYLVLLSNFLLNGIDVKNPVFANWITTAILAALGGLGLLRGLVLVQRIEKYVVGINLAVIAALLAGLVWHNGYALAVGDWHLGSDEKPFTLHSVQVLLGLLIVVQGFETSRFMGDEFDAETRIKTMRYAQWISTIVYLAFFLLMTLLFPLLGQDTGITAVVGLVGHVALVLPVMLTVGAIASQFSASVADSVGCAGLIEDIADKRITLRHAYPLIAVIAITITWNADVFRIITLASQAFALFYFAQAGVALAVLYDKRDLPNRTFLMGLFTAVALFCLSVVLFGIPSGG